MDTSASNNPSPSGPAVMGLLLRSVAALPREPSTEILVTQAFLQADARALQGQEFRSGLAACLAALRCPSEGEPREQDAAQWEQLFSHPLAAQLLVDPRLTPEQRLANLSFFLLRSDLPVELLSPAEGHLTGVAAHEAQLALQAFPPEQVAPIARFPAALVPRFPELAGLPQPVDAQALSTLVPHGLRPDQAALILGALADEALGSVLDESPVKAQRQALATLAAEGLRALAERVKAETEPQVVAQLLVLGGLQHQAFFQNLAPFTEDALARHEQPLGTVSAVGGVAWGQISTSVLQLGMALGGPVGTNTARVILSKVSQAVEALRAGEKLPLGALSGAVLGIPGLGLAPRAIGEVVAALTQLYALRLAELEDEAISLLGDLLPLLMRGEVEGLGAGWITLLSNPERGELLQNTNEIARAQVLGVLLVGGAVGAFAWEEVAPTFQAQGQTLLGHALPAETPPATVPALYASSAAWAVAVLANENLYDDVCSGAISPEQALTQAREFGMSLFVGGTDPADPPLTAAMLRGLTPPGLSIADDPDGDEA